MMTARNRAADVVAECLVRENLPIDHQPREALRLELGAEHRHHSRQQRQSVGDLFILRHTVDHRSWSQRGQQRRRFSFAGDRNDCGGVTRCRERHGRLA
jgi:hypothetical protein